MTKEPSAVSARQRSFRKEQTVSAVKYIINWKMTPLWQCEKTFEIFENLLQINKKNQEITCSQSSWPYLNAWLVQQLQPQVFLNMTPQAWHTWCSLVHCSLQHCSGSIRLLHCCVFVLVPLSCLLLHFSLSGLQDNRETVKSRMRFSFATYHSI